MGLDKRLDDITEEDLLSLVGTAEESPGLDLKLDLYPHGEGGWVELCGDVTALANARGGDIIIGVDELDRVAAGVPGVILAKGDSEERWITQIVRSHTEPKLTSFRPRAIPLSDGRFCIVIRVERSWNKPHFVTNGAWKRFYLRTGTISEPLGVPEIRSAILASEGMADRLRSFAADRLSVILSGDAPVPLPSKPTIVYHLVPLDAFEPGASCNMVALSRWHRVNPPIMANCDRVNYNFDGVLLYYHDRAEASSNTYVQVFHNGAIEAAVSAHWPGEEDWVLGLYVENHILACIIHDIRPVAG